MAAVLFRCPTTGMKVQAWLADDPANDGDTFEVVTRLHPSASCQPCRQNDRRRGRVAAAPAAPHSNLIAAGLPPKPAGDGTRARTARRSTASRRALKNHSLGGALPRYVVCTAPTTHAINARASCRCLVRWPAASGRWGMVVRSCLCIALRSSVWTSPLSKVLAARLLYTHGYGATREEALQSLARSWHMRKGPGDIPEPEASRVIIRRHPAN
jgi:hypothetical protein